MSLTPFSRGITLRGARFHNQTYNKITMKNLIAQQYLAPQVREIELSLERGFAASLEDPIIDPEIEW
jgi:hypothetical protein